MLHAVVMAGGSGTRFWPKSRRNRPKQLLRTSTATRRCSSRPSRGSRRWSRRSGPGSSPGPTRPRPSARSCPSCPPANVVAEPCPRDTAAVRRPGGARSSPRHDPDGTMIVMPADHVIRAGREVPDDRRGGRRGDRRRPDRVRHLRDQADPARDRLRLHRARRVARDARAGSPCTRSSSSARSPTGRPPSGSSPTGRFAWNSGIFVWRARAILDALATHRPAARRRPRPGRAGARHPRRGRGDRPRIPRRWRRSRSTRP